MHMIAASEHKQQNCHLLVECRADAALKIRKRLERFVQVGEQRKHRIAQLFDSVKPITYLPTHLLIILLSYINGSARPCVDARVRYPLAEESEGSLQFKNNVNHTSPHRFPKGVAVRSSVLNSVPWVVWSLLF